MNGTVAKDGCGNQQVWVVVLQKLCGRFEVCSAAIGQQGRCLCDATVCVERNGCHSRQGYAIGRGV